jgi:23S rRNA (cytidine1920-2'-O)/16S rRNA (cytidine1409-2'-O)-methyltransferase
VSGDQYVGRGAYKLEHALDYWKIDPTNFTGLDIGSSTGGFTEVLLRRGAQKVFAVDVGSNQLAKELLENPKVISLESTDIRTLGFLPSVENIDQTKNVSAPAHTSRADIVVIDVSFISLGQIFPNLKRFVSVNSPIVVALIKPQFEVGKAYIQKNGVVADAAQVKTALERVKKEALEEGWICKEVIESPIHGGQGGSGNTEYLGYFVQK